MAVRPLRPATDRRFGGPLPRQLANQMRIHSIPDLSFSHCVMPHRALMRYYQPFPAAIPQIGPGYPHVTHPSATKLQHDSLCTSTPLLCVTAPFDLHVLGTPPAFILSQDRTLEFGISLPSGREPCSASQARSISPARYLALYWEFPSETPQLFFEF